VCVLLFGYSKVSLQAAGGGEKRDAERPSADETHSESRHAYQKWRVRNWADNTPKCKGGLVIEKAIGKSASSASTARDTSEGEESEGEESDVHASMMMIMLFHVWLRKRVY
jgi:hypothetical protein